MKEIKELESELQSVIAELQEAEAELDYALNDSFPSDGGDEIDGAYNSILFENVRELQKKVKQVEIEINNRKMFTQ